MKGFISLTIAMLCMSFAFAQPVDRPVKPKPVEEATPIAQTIVSPNPVSYYLRIETVGWSPHLIVLYNVEKEIVLHQYANVYLGHSLTLDVRHLPSGNYELVMIGNDHCASHRVLISQRVQHGQVAPTTH